MDFSEWARLKRGQTENVRLYLCHLILLTSTVIQKDGGKGEKFSRMDFSVMGKIKERTKENINNQEEKHGLPCRLLQI